MVSLWRLNSVPIIGAGRSTIRWKGIGRPRFNVRQLGRSDRATNSGMLLFMLQGAEVVGQRGAAGGPGNATPADHLATVRKISDGQFTWDSQPVTEIIARGDTEFGSGAHQPVQRDAG